MLSGDQYGILQRLLLNEKPDPSPEGLFRILGFVHLYTASGLHLLALEAFLNRFLARSLFTKKLLTIGFWLFLFLIWKLQGFRLGFARILLLFFLKAMARVNGLRWKVYYPLFLAFCFDFALGIDSGWQHYYLAILGGMLGLAFAQDRSTFIQHVFLSVGSWWMTAPLDLWMHHEIAWMTPVWSLITIPVIAYFLYPASVFSYLLLDRVPDWLVNIWNQGADLLLFAVDYGLTFSVVDHYWTIISLCLALMAAVFYRHWVWIFSGVILVLAFRFHPMHQRMDGLMKLTQIDVGQGDSLLLQRGSRVEMVDLGPSQNLKVETMIHRLALLGVTRVDTVLFSHLDEDHAGAVRWLLPWVAVDAIEVNSRFERTAVLRGWLTDFSRTRWCSHGCFQLGMVDWVSANQQHTRRSLSGNDLMATAIIPLTDDTVYLALGDSDFKQEDIFWSRHHSLVERYRHRILKISHHGSKYSSHVDFLSRVSPDLAVVSAGRRNHYHHPHFSVLQHLRNGQIPVHRTDRDGNYAWSSH